MTAPIMAGAEPFSADGGQHGVLVLHGFTGNPHSMRGLALAFADAGFAVECPLLPGHGTAAEDLLDKTFADWTGAADVAYEDLAARVHARGGKVAVAALSMGGTLALWLAARHPEIAGLALVNPLCEPAGPLRDLVQGAVDQGEEFVPGIGSDIADPDSHELSYDGTPLRAALSLFDGLDELQPLLPKVACPALVFTSPNDHVVPPSNSDHLAATVSGPVERVTLERSYHVATLDYDRVEIEASSVEFARKVTAA